MIKVPYVSTAARNHRRRRQESSVKMTTTQVVRVHIDSLLNYVILSYSIVPERALFVPHLLS